MLRIFALILCAVSANAASSAALDCKFDRRCSSLTAECVDEPLRIRADFVNGKLTILENGNVFKAQVVEDRVMPFRSFAVIDGRGAIGILSVHDDLSAVYTYNTGLPQVGAIWSSFSGMCREKS